MMMGTIAFIAANFLLLSFMAWLVHRSGRKLGQKEIEQRALKEANKAMEESNKKYGKITQETLLAIDDGEQLMCDILRPKS